MDGYDGAAAQNTGAGLIPVTSDMFTPTGTLDTSKLPPATGPEPMDLAALVSGDIAWVLVATALVLLMTPGLAFFYGGMVRNKNVISTIMQSFITIGLISLLWVFLGYSLAFGDDINYSDNPPIVGPGGRRHGSIYGNPSTYYFFKDVGAAPNTGLAATIPNLLYALFQLMFAVITPALITGGFAERVNFPALALFVLLWHFVLYCPLAHSVWHFNGILKRFGTLDFAGGTVVHMSSGYAGLVGSWFLGQRREMLHTPANVPFTLLGTALLWFGWFGFNAGSALAANVVAVQAFCTTNTAAAAAMISWLLIDIALGFKPRATGACAGAVVGLVVITPAAGYVDVGAAIVMGIVGAAVCHSVARYMKQSKFDDTLDAFSCHGIGGTVGFLMTGLFASVKVLPASLGGYNGGFLGSGWLFWHHVVTVLIIVPIIIGLLYVCYKLTDMIISMRVDESSERLGLDVSQHGEKMCSPPLDDEEFLNRMSQSVNKSIRGGNSGGGGFNSGAAERGANAAHGNSPALTPSSLVSSGEGLQRVSVQGGGLSL
ncbi:MAG: hypothetical protein WDW38_008315 [Sanguina aurantia]